MSRPGGDRWTVGDVARWWPAERRSVIATDRTMMAQRLVALLAALALTACAGGGGAENGSRSDEIEIGDDAVHVLGTDDLLFEPDELSAPAGDIEIALTCEDGINHNLVIIATGDEVAVCLPGGTGVGSVALEAGTYEFVCTIPGHSATMRGELTVG